MSAKHGQPPPNGLIQGRVAESGLQRRPNNFGYCNYIDRLFGMKCFRDIVELGAFTSAKDVSESMAALHGASCHGGIPLPSNGGPGGPASRRVLCICVGDGSTPRTAVLAAFVKGWECVSIDPVLRGEWAGRHQTVRGLRGFSGTLEDFIAAPPDPDALPVEVPSHLIVLCVHSHARFRGAASLSRLFAKCCGDHDIPAVVVSLPCCAKFRHVGDIGRPPDVRYDDDCVFSACRTVEIWNFPKKSDVQMCSLTS